MTFGKKKSPRENFVYGFHAVIAVLRYQPERCKKLLIARKNDVDELFALCKDNGIPYEIIDRTALEKRFDVGSDAQGIVLICSTFSYAALEDLLHPAAKKILVLDSWQDSVNLGRAARAALCFGADGMIICKDRSAEINAAAEKSAVGALCRIPVARVVNLAAAIQKIKEAGFFVYGADERGDVPLNTCDFANKAALVIGQEGEGLRSLTKKNCDLIVSIPMSSGEICLNAADTALLMLYQLSNLSKSNVEE